MGTKGEFPHMRLLILTLPVIPVQTSKVNTESCGSSYTRAAQASNRLDIRISKMFRGRVFSLSVLNVKLPGLSLNKDVTEYGSSQSTHTAFWDDRARNKMLKPPGYVR